MSTFFLIAAIIAIALTVLSLSGGLLSMVKGADFREKHANKLMKARVICQGAAIVFLYLAFSTSS